MINKQFVAGPVEKVKLSYTKNNEPVLNFTVKTWTTYNGKQYPEWVRCVLWGDRAATANLKDGDIAVVEGVQKTRSWDKDDGTKAYMTECNVKVLETINGVQAADGMQAADVDSQGDEDLPF